MNLQETEEKFASENTLEDIFENIVGAVSDSGKTLEDYREERITERKVTA